MQGIALSSLFVCIVHKLEGKQKYFSLTPPNRICDGTRQQILFTVQDFVLFRSLILRKRPTIRKTVLSVYYFFT